MKWNTAQVGALALSLTPSYRTLRQAIIPAYGDYLTNGLQIGLEPAPSDEGFLPSKIDIYAVRATHPPFGPEEDRNEAEADLIVMQSLEGQGDGGIQTLNEATSVLAARIACHLRRNGWKVLPTTEGLF